MMIPRQAPLAGTTAAVFDKRKHKSRGPESTETIACAAGGRDLPARHGSAGVAAKGLATKPAAVHVRMQDEAESAACAGSECEPTSRREIGFLARKFGYHHTHGAALERLLHGQKCIPRARHSQNDKALR